MEDRISVVLNGKNIEINIVDIFINPETGNELMLYTIDDYNEGETLVSLLRKNDAGFELDFVDEKSDIEFLSKLSED